MAALLSKSCQYVTRLLNATSAFFTSASFLSRSAVSLLDVATNASLAAANASTAYMGGGKISARKSSFAFKSL